MSQTTLMPEWLCARAAATPERLALITPEAQLSFAALDGLVDLAVQRLRALGVQRGERVALLLGNGVEFVVLAHAVPRAGGVLVPLNTRLAPSELAWQLGDCGARLLIYDAANRAAALTAAQKQPGTAPVAAEDAVAQADAARPGIPARLVDLAAVHTIIYTSGTTGRPKGAMLTFGNHWWSAVGSALNLGHRIDDRWLAVLPLFHVGGLAILLRGVIGGVPVVLHRAFDPAAVNRAIEYDGVTHVSVVSAMLQRMLDERAGRPYPPTLRCLLLGGGPAPRPLLEACARLGAPVVQTYGLTETASQLATLSPDDALRKLGSAGKPLLHSALRILTGDGEAEPGEAGEIAVRGPTVTAGYLNRPEETAARLRDGWLHTGDLGYLDAEGYLYVLDRRDDLIISGGENVYPADVEAVLLAHPEIEEAGVVGVPDARWGQAPVAAVRLRPGSSLDEAAVIAFCAERLARYKLPVRVVFVDVLPRTASGKLRRAELRTALSAD